MPRSTVPPRPAARPGAPASPNVTRIAARRLVAASACVAVLLAPAAAHAGGAGGGGLAWESPLQLVANSITGPVAGAVSLLGITVAGGMLIWGGELNEFVRRIVMVVLVIALIVGAASLLSALFGVGAVLPAAGESPAAHLAATVAQVSAAAVAVATLRRAQVRRRAARAA